MPRQTKRATAAEADAAQQTQANNTADMIADEKPVYHVKEAAPLTMSDYVTVRNGFNGKLVYKSKKTGEKFVWDGFGAEQDMELAELKNAKNSSKAFFENNWFMFDRPEIISFLGVDRFYKHALNFDNFDSLFKMNPDSVGARIAKLSDGQKLSVRYRARQLIADGVIDSLKMINALEQALDTQLIEQ